MTKRRTKKQKELEKKRQQRFARMQKGGQSTSKYARKLHSGNMMYGPTPTTPEYPRFRAQHPIIPCDCRSQRRYNECCGGALKHYT